MRALLLLVLLASAGLHAQPDAGRTRTALNENWRFLPQGLAFAERPSTADAGWDVVSLPHTWNAEDPFDDPESYRRGESWYRRHLRLGDEMRGKRLTLHFEGVGQSANVYVNGAYAGHHDGGYTAFTVDITDLVTFGDPVGTGVEADNAGAVRADDAGGDNLIAVQVRNAHDPFVPPLSVGYALYGGIYRDVWLVSTGAAHFATDDHGSSGVAVATPAVSAARASAGVRSTVVNDDSLARSVRVVQRLLDPAGREIGQTEQTVRLDPGARQSLDQAFPGVPSPRLWSPDTPNLYRVVSETLVDGRVADRVTSPLGFRWFAFDTNTGFSLNGEKLVLRGTNRHQDYAGLGSALPDAAHVRDLQIIKDMGANFLRLAHYPQDPAVLEAADRLGILIWEEIPVVNYINTSERFTENAETMLREMIRQHRNHPSVILWGSMNEVFLWSEQGARIRQQTDMVYAEKVRRFAVRLDSLIRAEDPSRVTAMAIHGNNFYETAGVEQIPQVLGINLYNGWYGGVFDTFGPTLDRQHASHPEQNLFVSEYGAGSDGRINSLEPSRFDYSTQWTRMFHESYLRQIAARPYLAGTAVWNQFDFSQPHTGGSISHMNQKGLLTWDRRPKDVYFLYKANWNPAPLVHIASHEWTVRSGTMDTRGRVAAQPLDVYSNLGRVELFVNGVSQGVRTPDDVRKASWSVVFQPGDNLVEARGEADGVPVSDQLTIHMEPVPARLADRPFERLGVDVGARVQYVDDHGQMWVEDQPYRAGSYGFTGGEPASFNKDDIILGTADPGLVFTYRSGIDGYRFDVPDGDYTLELRMAEPEGASAGARVFGVSINGRSTVDALDLSARYGPLHTAALRFDATAEDGEGVEVRFPRQAGDPVLSAISITRK